MAAHVISIMGANTIPDDSGLVFFQPYSVIDTGAVFDPQILTFAFGTSRDGVRGSFTVPENYATANPAEFRVVWTANSALSSDSARWEMDYRSVADGEDFGLSAQESLTITDDHQGTIFFKNTAAMGITEANLTAGDTVTWELFRDQAEGTLDDLTVDVAVFHILFKYEDS